MEKKFILAAILTLTTLVLFSQQENRTYDGSNNNLLNPEWGATHTQLRRIAKPQYADKISTPGGVNRPNPRKLSNALFAQEEGVLLNDKLSLSDYTWVFGQFIDHDITLSEGSNEPAMIVIDFDDPHFNPGGQIPNVMIPMTRTEPMEGTGTDQSNPRQHFNRITAWIDASAVYGSDAYRANWLRSGVNGKLKVSEGNLLPYNTITGEFDGEVDIDAPHMADDVGFAPRLFVGGDVRTNENALLTSFHTIFVREHNRLCEEYAAQYPNWSDEQLYQKVRKIVGGLLQSITYEEWLPVMGVELHPYEGYDSSIDPSISNIFSGAAFRMGHTLLNGNLNRVDVDGNPHPDGPLALRDAFFNPGAVAAEGIEPFLKGMGIQIQQDMDAKVVDDVRNFLFGPPGAGGLDLAAININRGRERGLPDFNSVRKAFGLRKYDNFTNIINDDIVAGTLDEMYGNVNDIDPWVGMLAEQQMANALFGETVMSIMHQQFQALRDGDRFYYENDAGLTSEEKSIIKKTTFSDIIMRNTNIVLMQDNVFQATEHQSICGYYGEDAVLWGDVMSASNVRIADVNVKLTTEGNESIVSELIDGTFSVEGIPTCEDITMTLSKEDDYRTGVSTLDMIMLLRHIVGLTPFNSAYQYIAADANNSGAVTTADIIAIRKVILGIEDEFPNNTSWRFVDASYQFINPSNPFAEDFPESAALNLSQDASQDFVAIKVGDINDSSSRNAFTSNSTSRNKKTLTLQTEDMELVAGNTYTIPFQAQGEELIAGYQFSLKYNNSLEFIQAPKGKRPKEEIVSLTNGMLTALYFGPQYIHAKDFSFELTFLAIKSARLSDVLTFQSSSLPTEAYNEQLEVMNVEMTYLSNPMLQVKQNQPNPFTGWTVIGFELPVAGFVDFEVTDLSGKQLVNKRNAYDKGYNEIQVSQEELGATGILYYHLKTDQGSTTKKMVVID